MSTQYFAIGGTQACPGGVEIFLQRLQWLWPLIGLGKLTMLPAQTAVLKAPGGVRRALQDWLRALVRSVCLVRAATRTDGGGVVVWYHYGNGLDLLSLAVLSLVPGIRLIVTPHCSLTWRHLRGPVRRLAARWLMKRVERIFVLSEEQCEFYARWRPSGVARMRTLLPEVSDDAAPFHARQRGSLAFVGRVVREKGIVDVVELLRLLRADGGDFSLDVLGAVAPDMRDFFARVASEEPSLFAAIRLHGDVSSDRVLAQLGCSRYLIHLSRVDAFPLTVLEAILRGAVPVAYELPGTAEIIERWGGLLARPGEVRAIAQALRAMEAQTLCVSLRREAAVHYYSGNETARELRALLES